MVPTVVLVAVAFAAQGKPSSGPDAAGGDLTQARAHIKHIVFLIKENRTFDTMFGRFPGAAGARYGRLCGNTRLVALRQAVLGIVRRRARRVGTGNLGSDSQ